MRARKACTDSPNPYRFSLGESEWQTHSRLKPNQTLIDKFNATAKAEGQDYTKNDTVVLLKVAKSCEAVMRHVAASGWTVSYTESEKPFEPGVAAHSTAE